MSDIKSDFREWLQEQNYLPKTINQHIYNIDKLCLILYGNKDWSRFSEDALYLLAKYSEYANREYYLDIVTIKYALDYFFDFYRNVRCSNDVKNKENNDVKLYLYFSKKSYDLATVRFDEISDYLSILDTILYGRPETKISLAPKQVKDFIDIIENLVKQKSIRNKKRIAIHIEYKKKTAQLKLAISKYCSFLQLSQPKNTYFSMLAPVTTKIKTKNPNKTIHGHYSIVQQISGNKPIQVKAEHEADRLDVYFTLTRQDLSKIFDLHPLTIDTLLEKIKWETNKTAQYDEEDYKFGAEIFKEATKRDMIIEYDTEIRTYYNVDNVNNYLREHHHCHYYKEVDYTKEGYKYWCNRKKAIETIGISKTAFFEHIWGVSKKDILSVSYIDYTQFATRYYLPEIKFLKTMPVFKRILYRK